MNITIFIGGLSGGGAERVVCNLSNYLSKNHNVTILTMSENDPDYDISKNVKRVTLFKKGESNSYLIKNFKRLIRFRKHINQSDTDVYLVMLDATINLMLYHRKYIKVPIIISERSDPRNRYKSSKIRKWIMKKLYPKADGFIFQTKDSMKYYREVIGKDGKVIPNAINPEFIREPYSGKRKKEIVSVGRMTEQKNFTLLIDAFSKVANKYPEYKLLIYGKGPDEIKLKKQVARFKLEERVIFPGYVNDIANNIIDSTIFVLSSNYEGMPNSLMEAMALGLPCISTDCPIGGPKYLIENNHNGILVPTNNPKEMVTQLDRLLSNTEMRNRLGENAKLIADDLNYGKIYKEWEDYIKYIVDK